MKKFVLFLVSLLSVGLVAAQDYLPVIPQNNGEVMVNNAAGVKATDKLFVANHTPNHLVLTVKGMHAKEGLVTIAQVTVMSGMKIALSTRYEDRLKMFSNFYFSVNDFSIAGAMASVSHHDLLFTIEQVENKVQSLEPATPQTAASTSVPASSSDDVEEQLMRLKKWLDAGFITQEEFNAKRRELIGF